MWENYIYLENVNNGWLLWIILCGLFGSKVGYDKFMINGWMKFYSNLELFTIHCLYIVHSCLLSSHINVKQ